MRTEETTTISHIPQEKVVTTHEVVVPEEMVVPRPASATYEREKNLFRTYQALWYVLGVVEALLAFRVALKFVGASTTSGFVSLLYGVTDPLALPFQGILGTTTTGASVMEWSTFIAMIVYFMLSVAVVELLQFIKPVSPREVKETIQSV